MGCVLLYYQKLDVYKCSIEFLTLTIEIESDLQSGNSALKDQLKRAALSIPLNIAESSGKTTTRDRAEYLAIARGSAMESGACLDCLKTIHSKHTDKANRGLILVERIVEMLSKMCR